MYTLDTQITLLNICNSEDLFKPTSIYLGVCWRSPVIVDIGIHGGEGQATHLTGVVVLVQDTDRPLHTLTIRRWI